MKRVYLKRLLALGTRLYAAAALIGAYLLLVGLGLVFAHSTGEFGAAYPTREDVAHLARALLGMGCGALVLLPHWRHYERWAYAVYAIAIAGLIAVLVFGPPVRGTRRWLDLGFMRFQVSEVAKVALVLALARLIKAAREKESVRTSLAALALTALPVLLVMKEPDLGTSMLLPPILVAMLFAGRGRLSHVAIIVLAGAALVPFFYEFGLEDYQRRRLVGYLSPDAKKLDPDIVLQRERAREAIGTGGWTGKGLGEGDPTIPVRKSDFIFAVIAEEMGYVGATFLLVLYAIFIYFGLEIGAGTHDLFGRLACVGISIGIAVQALTNVAMAVGILPITGLNLPLISQGGSSLLATSIGAGIILNIALRPPYTLAQRSRLLRG